MFVELSKKMNRNEKLRCHLIKRVLEQEGRCHYCERAFFQNQYTKLRPTLDHLYPKALGGTNHYDNLVAACHTCNCLKANMTLIQFLNFLSRPRGLKRVATTRTQLETYHESI